MHSTNKTGETLCCKALALPNIKCYDDIYIFLNNYTFLTEKTWNQVGTKPTSPTGQASALTV